MKKKSLIVVGSIIVVVLGFAGCSNDSTTTNSSTETTKVTANTDKQIEAPKVNNTATPKTSNEKKESPSYGGIDPNVVEHKEMNGSNNAQIGTYATTTYDATTTTDADIIRFYNDKIKDSKNNYFTLIDGTNSIEFCGSNADTMIKGPIENSHRSVVKPIYYGQIDGSKIKWEKPNKDTV